MSEIQNQSNITPEQKRQQLASLEYHDLLAQDLVQQGAVHALSTLLTIGCDEQNAIEMMASLRFSAQLIRDEFNKRGLKPAFTNDQTNFN